jgi:4'-phosphopantetheinyl transferase
MHSLSDLDSPLWRADSGSFPAAGGRSFAAGGSRAPWPGPGEVHLHGMDLDATARGSGVLSVDELHRAERFHFERDRHRFIAGRSFVRAVLGRYLEMRPDQLEFSYSAAGKPELAGATPPLRFSFSHAAQWAVLGVSASAVGVDVEHIRPVPDLEDVASRFFAPREAETVLAAEGSERLLRFLSCWTRKEAFVKATGVGIGSSMPEFEVTMVAGDIPRIVVHGENLKGWTLLAPNVRAELVVAVAVRNDAAWIGC